MAAYEPLVEIRKDPIEIDGLGMAVYDVAKQLISISPDIPDEAAQILDQNKDPARLGDITAATVDLSSEERASLLVEVDVAERLRRLLVLLQRKVELIKVKQKIDTQVREEFSKHQREAVLRQKLKAIQDELGEGDDGTDLDAFEEKIKAAEMPEEVDQGRPQAARAPAADAAVLGRIHRAAHLPGVAGRAALDQADRRHAGPRPRPQDPRRRSLRPAEGEEAHPRVPGGAQAGARARRGPSSAWPARPGVGKTSLGKSIARSLSREFIRVSLGGVRDEAEIRGHRRTYIGALPGRIVQGMRRVGTKNPVFVLDEIDKLGSDFRGDPAAALLEVLDPEQNHAFSDHYLEVLVRPVERHLHRHRQQPRHHPAGAARPHGGAGDPRLHPGGEAGDRQAPPGAQADLRARADRRADRLLRRHAQHHHRAVHPRGRGAEPRARDRQRRPRRGGQGGRERALRPDADARAGGRLPGAAEVLLRGGRADRGAGGGHRAWPGCPPAATSSSSRRR